jgi:hypothetical protein
LFGAGQAIGRRGSTEHSVGTLRACRTSGRITEGRVDRVAAASEVQHAEFSPLEQPGTARPTREPSVGMRTTKEKDSRAAHTVECHADAPTFDGHDRARPEVPSDLVGRGSS